MALKAAQGGDFLDLVELGKERVLLAARIQRIDAPQPHKYDPAKTTTPVVADLMLLTGNKKGWIQREQLVLASGVTPTLLRGNKVGDTVLLRLETRNSFGKDWAAAQSPTDEDMARYAPLFEKDDPFDRPGVNEQEEGSQPVLSKDPWS